jgi:hypothetical protein
MTYIVPPPVNLSYAARTAGRSDAVFNEVGAIIEEPIFVDNAVHHGIYEVSQNKEKTIKINAPNQKDFQVTHPRKYRLSEEESSVRLAHERHEDAPFFNGELLSPTSSRPMLLFDSEDHALRLRTQQITTTSQGVRIQLNNMRGKSLSSYNMSNTSHVYAGQTMSVGLKSTDLVEKLFTKALHGLNSVSTKGESALFLAQNFNSLVLPSAIRYIARHDHFLMYYDRHGNFTYAPKIFKVKDRELGQQRGLGMTKIDPIVEIANRIAVKGKAIAVNDGLRLQIDDAEMQKRHGSIKEIVLKDPTAKNESMARKTAGQALRLNRKAQGALKSERHAMSWDFEPGDVVDYNSAIGNVKQAIVELTHTSKGESNFSLISYEAGLESVLTTFGDFDDINEEDEENDRTFQVQSINKSGIGSAKMRVRGMLNIRPVSAFLTRSLTTALNTSPDIHAGVLLGHRNADYGAGRSALGFGVTPRTNGTFAVTTITVADTTGFGDSGHLILEDQSFVSYSAKTPTTFTGVTLISGATIPAIIGELRMLRPRAHEMRNNKGLRIRRKI